MKIGVLITGHPPEELIPVVGDYGKAFAKLLEGHGFDFESWAVVDGVFPESIKAADGWLITGSRHGAYEDHDWIPPLEDFIREIHSNGRPLIGVCFGHQIIAQALGGKVEKFAGGWSVGRTEYELGGETYALNAWHQDQVVDLPPGAEVIGATDFCKYAALAYGDRIWTVQPHPEYDSGFMDGLIRLRGKGVVPENQLQAATDDLDLPLDRSAIADQMAAFFKKERT